jgi:uncharacterized Tic20 family protein
MLTNSEKKWAAFTHLSTLSQYCFPLGNYVFPLIIWVSKKDESEYLDYNGKHVLNFQLSILLYSLILGAIIVPVFIAAFFNNIPFYELRQQHHFVIEEFNFGENIGLMSTGLIAVFLLACLKIVEFFLIIQATIKTANGEEFRYHLTIQFLK